MERLEESAWGLLERELFLTVPLLHDRLIKPFEGLLRQGFSPMQFYTLVLLRRKTSMAMTELAANFHIPKQQMTRIVNRLAELELVQRTGDPGDRLPHPAGPGRAGALPFPAGGAPALLDGYPGPG